MSVGPKTTLVLEKYSTPVSDSQGGADVTWYSVRKYTGTLMTNNKYESQYSSKIVAEASHLFLLDYTGDTEIDEKDRFVQYNRVFKITGIPDKTNQQRRRFIYLREIV